MQIRIHPQTQITEWVTVWHLLKCWGFADLKSENLKRSGLAISPLGSAVNACIAEVIAWPSKLSKDPEVFSGQWCSCTIPKRTHKAHNGIRKTFSWGKNEYLTLPFSCSWTHLSKWLEPCVVDMTHIGTGQAFVMARTTLHPLTTKYSVQHAVASSNQAAATWADGIHGEIYRRISFMTCQVVRWGRAGARLSRLELLRPRQTGPTPRATAVRSLSPCARPESAHFSLSHGKRRAPETKRERERVGKGEKERGREWEKVKQRHQRAKMQIDNKRDGGSEGRWEKAWKN